MVTTARLKGKYLPPVPCTITVRLGGTQTERIFVWNVKRSDKADEMTMVGGGKSQHFSRNGVHRHVGGGTGVSVPTFV